MLDAAKYPTVLGPALLASLSRLVSAVPNHPVFR